MALCQGFSGTTAEEMGLHVAFKAAKKTFAYYVYDHHGDGRIALLCKAPPGEQESLVRDDPDLYFVPPYVGRKGWIGFRLDSRRIDWKRVRELVSVARYLAGGERLPKKR